MFTSLPDELITLVAEKLYVHDGTLANFAAASAACQSAAKDSLLEALRKLERLHEKLEGPFYGRISSSRRSRALQCCLVAAYALTETKAMKRKKKLNAKLTVALAHINAVKLASAEAISPGLARDGEKCTAAITQLVADEPGVLADAPNTLLRVVNTARVEA